MGSTPRVVGVGVLAVFIVTAGCIGVLTGSEPIVVEAEPVSVSAAAQDAAGYVEVRRETDTQSREVSVSGQTRTVEVTNHIAEYARSATIEAVGTGELARFVIVSTPAVEVLGRTFNPVGEMSNEELVELVQDQYEGLEDVRPVGERSVGVLGTEATVSAFTGDAVLGSTGVAVELTIHVTRLRHGDDFVVAIAVHPSRLDGEAERVDAMLTGVEHES